VSLKYYYSFTDSFGLKRRPAQSRRRALTPRVRNTYDLTGTFDLGSGWGIVRTRSVGST